MHANDTFGFNQGGYIVGFNGDDVRALVKINATDTVIIDQIGLYDLVDPGNGWDVAGVNDATKDHSLVRKAEVFRGNKDWNIAAGTDSLSSEWIVYPKDTTMYLGSHTMNPVTATYLWSTSETTGEITINPVVTTTYTVVATIGNCSTEDSVVVTVNPSPIVSITATEDTICLNEVLTLDAGSGFVTYLWDDGSTTQTITVDGAVLGIGTHDFEVIVTNANACKEEAEFELEVVDCTGIEDFNSSEITVYPNPANDIVNISLKGLYGELAIQITDIQGNVILNENLEASNGEYKKQFDFSKFAKGLYFIKLMNNESIRTEKVIIQ